MSNLQFNDQICILDGGFSSELEKNGLSFQGDPLWCSHALQTNPEAVISVHESFLQSGANIITTNSYQASVPGFQKYLGLSFEESVTLLKSSVKFAQAAKERYLKSISERKDILIAGSIGPYGASLADGSEYSGAYAAEMSYDELIEWHKPRVQYLVEAGVDVLAFETIPAAKEGEALMKLLKDFPGTKAWLSFSSQSAHKTSAGDDICDTITKCLKIAPANQLVAIGVNCCPPDLAVELLKDICLVSHGFPLIVYPNSGAVWDSKLGWTNQNSPNLSSYVPQWMKSSAKIIGGCCCTTSDDILQITNIVNDKKIN
ncbi:uncharacterized protein LOC129225719 [Uloborus diversus]|uniref:uncharacterized protein LOC129225719 n=1 Tax=Uloborus diversus TaxID=327109 RepID=UPI0024096AE0|nr:uncharacterized protein LOC129225719 [Uloborus diversus]XP_054716186.1 uncharacterized protein LOC129225719 [Uloborus diversus]XP_054716187.1 uncharacterized protein LOC129225719 [Uloborus diversus]XP_054716188.1 uncharacterized protein LOC129225719 [Uloborus diversus]